MRHDMRADTKYRLFFALKPSTIIARQTDHLAETLGGGERRIRRSISMSRWP